LATAVIPLLSKASNIVTPVMGLSPTATSAPASLKASIAAATTCGCVVTPVPGCTFRPTLGLSNTRLFFEGDKSIYERAFRVLLYGSSPDAQYTEGKDLSSLKGVCDISFQHSQ
jgi:hypothetical protein